MKTLCSALMSLLFLSVGAAFAQPEGNPASSPAAAPESPEAVISTTGDRITGHILSIGKDGVLRMTTPYFERETGLRIAGLWRATFSPAVHEPGPHAVLLTSGDQIVGKVIAVTLAEVAVETAVAGKVAIPRALVAEIRFSPVAGPPRTDFAAGETEPFRDVLSVEGAGRVRFGQAGPVLLAADYAQDKAITVLLDLGEGNLPFALSIFAADAQQPRRNSLTLESTGETAMLHANTQNAMGEYNFGETPGKDGLRTARLAYDPATGELRVWLNGKATWTGTRVPAPATGKCIVISCPARMSVARIQVLEGIVMPADERPAPPKGVEKEEQRDVVVLTNGDRLTAQSLSIADGAIKMRLAEGSEVSVPLERADALSFRNSARKIPPVIAHSVQVATGRSVFMLDSVVLNDKSASGPSSMLGGEVTVDRAALKSLRFGPDPAPPAVRPRPGADDKPGASIKVESTYIK